MVAFFINSIFSEIIHSFASSPNCKLTEFIPYLKFLPLKKQTAKRHQHNKTIFCSINSLRGLCNLLQIDERRLYLMSKQPRYKTFTIPKKGGGERQIEAPDHALKQVLGRLNRYLQSVYYFEKSSAAFGFIVGVQNDEDRRNVVANAKKHIGKPYLLNVDIKDFFHAVTRDMVLQIFLGKPFRFKRELPDILADLCTYNGRLPMGTPTSPVLSNLACRALDDELTDFATDMLWSYTRYADDMSFSSKQYINAEMIRDLRNILKKHGFEFNERKLKVYGPDDQKIITGLLVTEKVQLAPGYIPQLKEEINRLQHALVIQNEQGQLATQWIEKHKKLVRGRLNFAGFVLKRDEQFLQLKDSYYTAINPPQEDFNAVSWRGFPYNI